ncbi:MAG: septal ring lytic transglycosylase RlpA family protein [Pseudanabaena sp.]
MVTLAALWTISLSSILSGASLPIFPTVNLDKNTNSPSKYSYQEATFIDKNPSFFVRTRYAIALQVYSSTEWLILVNRQPTFVVKNLANAAIAATKLAAIMNSPDFDPKYLQPIEQDDTYLGKYKDQILFTVPKAGVVNPSLKLTQWINNLRVAAGVEPLTLVEAQKQMHQLAATGDRIDGIASWYGPYFQGRQTASGEKFEQQDFTAAHPSLPFNTYLKVTNLQNGKSVVVRINDRGPYFGDRNLDLSHAAAIALNCDEAGVVPISATVLVSSIN